VVSIIYAVRSVDYKKELKTTKAGKYKRKKTIEKNTSSPVMCYEI